MQYNTKNSSGKIIGTVTINDIITVSTYKKPVFIIDDINDVSAIKNNDRSDSFVLHLYDDYLLSIGEIAALYNVCYSNINRQINTMRPKTSKSEGRRNRAYGTHVSKTQSKRMSMSLKGREAPHYERTPEIREQISSSLKRYFKENPQDPTPHRENWIKGKYKDIDFHHGIGGTMYSIKNDCQYRFRSLLELSYMLDLEDDASVSSYEFEPFHIKCDDETSYTPDVLVNNEKVVELKSEKYLASLPEENYQRFLYKVEQGTKYCNEHGLIYNVVYDTDINFDSRRMKAHLRNHPELIEMYDIKFNQPNRVVK